MPRYFFHLREPDCYLCDEEGKELPDLEIACSFAILNVRDIIAGEVRQSGIVPLSHIIEITDEAGNVLKVIPYGDVVSFD